MKVLFATTEIYPFVKTGGLGDVSAALPPALVKAGIDVRLMLPGYDAILDNLHDAKELPTPGFFGAASARVLKGTLEGGIITYVLDCPDFFKGRTPYIDENGIDWPDNYLRFAAFCKAAVDLADKSWEPDIIHGHDWPCGLIPAYVRAKGAKVKTILTIHNIAYQGLFPAHVFGYLGLPPHYFSTEGVEYYEKVGFLKAGLFFADHITTVSPTYAWEIQHTDQGCGLQGLMQGRSKDLTGIINGMDCEIWCPFNDGLIVQKYNSKTIEKKDVNRKAILKESGLKTAKQMPVLGIISRLTPQKGLDLVLGCAESFLKRGCALIILGSGDRDLEEGFQALAQQWPKQVAVSTQYDEALAHRIQSGVDIMLMPSRAEPCGLVQMYALCYGTLPLVHKTGGLADTVDFSNGFVFEEASEDSLLACIDQAIALYQTPKEWQKLQKSAMTSNFSWDRPAASYKALYDTLAG